MDFSNRKIKIFKTRNFLCKSNKSFFKEKYFRNESTILCKGWRVIQSSNKLSIFTLLNILLN